jgi:hypothetical protein
MFRLRFVEGSSRLKSCPDAVPMFPNFDPLSAMPTSATHSSGPLVMKLQQKKALPEGKGFFFILFPVYQAWGYFKPTAFPSYRIDTEWLKVRLSVLEA